MFTARPCFSSLLDNGTGARASPPTKGLGGRLRTNGRRCPQSRARLSVSFNSTGQFTDIGCVILSWAEGWSSMRSWLHTQWPDEIQTKGDRIRTLSFHHFGDRVQVPKHARQTLSHGATSPPPGQTFSNCPDATAMTQGVTLGLVSWIMTQASLRAA